MKISKVVDEILDSWFGPNGEVWCKEENKFVDPDTHTKNCPECKALGPHEDRPFRYVPQDDYKEINP
jgi:hypothetical protein